MEPTPSVAASITTFVHQMRKMATPELSENIHKLSNSQIALALKILQNKNEMWESYQQGADPKMEIELLQIAMVLAGAAEGNKKSGFSLQSFLQSKDKQGELRDKQITNLVNTIQRSSLQLTQPHEFEEKTTDELRREMIGKELNLDSEIAAQFYRELAGGLIGKVKIEDRNVQMIKPEKCPGDWNQLIPQEIKDYVGAHYESIAPSIAIFLTQGIGVDPLNKALELIRDPLLPEAQFFVPDYPQFKFIKKEDDILLEVTTKGFLGLMDMNDGSKSPIENYKMTQLINLTTPTALVKMTIKPVESITETE